MCQWDFDRQISGALFGSWWEKKFYHSCGCSKAWPMTWILLGISWQGLSPKLSWMHQWDSNSVAMGEYFDLNCIQSYANWKHQRLQLGNFYQMFWCKKTTRLLDLLAVFFKVLPKVEYMNILVESKSELIPWSWSQNHCIMFWRLVLRNF